MCKTEKSSEGSISTLHTILHEKIFFKKACLSILYFYPCFFKKIDTYVHLDEKHDIFTHSKFLIINRFLKILKDLEISLSELQKNKQIKIL